MTESWKECSHQKVPPTHGTVGETEARTRRLQNEGGTGILAVKGDRLSGSQVGGSQPGWGPISPLPLANSVTRGKLLDLSVPWSSHPQRGVMQYLLSASQMHHQDNESQSVRRESKPRDWSMSRVGCSPWKRSRGP